MIVCIGIAVFDIIFDIDEQIQINKKNKAKGIRLSTGGNGVNVAKVLNYYDIPVQLVSPLGNDVFGELICKELTELGIHISNSTANMNTPISMILNNKITADRTIVNYTKPNLQPINEYPETCNIMYSDGRYPVYTREFRNHFIDTSIVWDWERYQHYLDNKDIVNNSDILICSEDFIKEVQDIYGMSEFESVQYLFNESGLQKIAITKGAYGVYYYDKTICEIPNIVQAIEIKAIDTNGAGDVFHALFIYYYLQKRDINYSLEMANNLTGEFVAKEGFVEALPPLPC